MAMSTLDPLAHAWLRWICGASWQMAILVCLVAAVTAAGAMPRRDFATPSGCWCC